MTVANSTTNSSPNPNPGSNPNPSPKPLSARREFWLLLTLAGVQFSHILDFMIMTPLGPQFTEIFKITDAQFGVLVSSYTFAAGISGLLAAFYLDRFDRKKLLIVLYSLFALSTLACGLAPDYMSLIAARTAAGVFGGVLSALTQTIVGDVIPYERRGKAMAIVMSSFSIATVAGVPLGLFFASHFNWHFPFIGIAVVCALLVLMAWKMLPPLRGHLMQAQTTSPLANLIDVASKANHQRALWLTFSMVFVGFVVTPYLTIYSTANGALTVQQVPWVYTVGGVLTLLTSRWIGRLSDTRGKVPMFRLLALWVIIPVVGVTVSAPLGFWGYLVFAVLMFILMSGRMIPGMAIITSACAPAQRGTFMALQSSVQSLAMSAAALIGGMLFSRDPQGQVVGFWMNGLLGAVASLLSWWLVTRIQLPTQPVTAAEKPPSVPLKK